MATAYVLIFMVLSTGYYGGTHSVAMHEFGNETACKAAGAAASTASTFRTSWVCVKKA
jgi:hypothetical protein